MEQKKRKIIFGYSPKGSLSTDSSIKGQLSEFLTTDSALIDTKKDEKYDNTSSLALRRTIQCDKEKDIKNNCKIFVGNVPYQCTQEDFEKCFEKVPGFIRAEIVPIQKTNLSRGFGFITMRSHVDAEKLKHRNDIIFKGRILRFTSYHQDNFGLVQNYSNNYVHVNGIPNGKNRNWLKDAFSDYEPIKKCFVMINHDSGERKRSGIIEVVEDSKYKSILAKKYHNINGDILDTTKYRLRSRHEQYECRENDENRKEKLIF